MIKDRADVVTIRGAIAIDFAEALEHAVTIIAQQRSIRVATVSIDPENPVVAVIGVFHPDEALERNFAVVGADSFLESTVNEVDLSVRIFADGQEKLQQLSIFIVPDHATRRRRPGNPVEVAEDVLGELR